MPEHPKQKKRNRRYLVLTAASAVMMVLSLVGMIFFACPFVGMGAGVEQRLGDDESGKQQRRQLVLSGTVGQVKIITPLPDLHWRHPQRQKLAVDLQFEQGKWMRMQITQQTRDGRTLERESRVTSDENIQYFSLEGFEEGTIKVRFYNNGVSGVKAQVRVA